MPFTLGYKRVIRPEVLPNLEVFCTPGVHFASNFGGTTFSPVRSGLKLTVLPLTHFHSEVPELDYFGGPANCPGFSGGDPRTVETRCCGLSASNQREQASPTPSDGLVVESEIPDLMDGWDDR